MWEGVGGKAKESVRMELEPHRKDCSIQAETVFHIIARSGLSDAQMTDRPELSTLSHSYLYNHQQQSLRFVEHPYNFNIANKTRA